MKRQELIDSVAWDVRNALLGEVYASPKPGLVDRMNQGAHKDMDFETFQASTDAITPYLTEMFLAGLDGVSIVQNQAAGFDPAMNYTEEESIFLSIRIIGMNAERAMFQSTHGINTHKGMIFTMGIVLAAAGICYRTKGRIQAGEVLNMTKRMTSRILEKEFQEMAAREPVTHGEKLFHRFGEKGIRGQAEEGFPILADVAMPVFKKLNMPCRQKPVSMDVEDAAEAAAEAEGRLKELLSLKPEQDIREDIRQEMETNRTWKWKPMEGPLYQNAAYVYVLLSIMSVLDDTNVLTRGTLELLEEVKARSREILRCGALFTEEGYRKVMEFNDFCVRENLSPGGAADILAVSILLNRLERLTP